jgi:hypothetical protein
MRNLDLFDPPETAPFQKHSPTSRAAALRIQPRLNALQQRVLDALRSCGVCGATDEELQILLCLGANTERPRRVELVAKGLVRASYAKRPTKTGCDARVWLAEPKR